MILVPKYVICAKMKTILAVSFWLLLGNLSLVRGEDACSFSQTRVTMDYNETVIGIQILDIEVNSETTITSWTVQEANSVVTDEKAKTYFDMNIINGHLIVSTTDLFGNLGDDADSSGNSLGFTMFVNVSCATTNQAIIVIIRDTFKNSPKFAKESYTYSLPMPIMQKTDITLYGDEIDISDSNFANTEMTLSISPDDFNVSASKTDNKHFTAVFSAKRILRFTENQTYVLTASNSGNKQTSVSIVIAVNAEEGLDAPSFTNTYYTFDYSNEGSGSLTPKDGDIAINSDKPNEAQYEISGDYTSYFTLTFDNSTKKFDLQLNPNEVFPSNIPSQIVLSISFTTDATTNAIVLVNIVNEVIPKFTSNYYTGTYDTDSNTITWKENVDVTNASDVTLSDDVSKLLKINPTTYEITPLSSLSKSNFDENLNIVFTVTASSSTKNEAYCTVVISLKTEATDDFKFDHVYYKGKYSEQDKSGVVVLDSEIGFSDISDTEGIEIEVDNDYKANFKIEPDSSSKWQVSIISRLNSTVLNDNSKLAIPITATKAGASTSATAVLILSLPVPIKFDNSYYDASYLEGTDGETVKLAQDITVTGINEGDNITVTVGDDYKTNFKIEPDSSSKWQVSIISRLNSTVLNDNSKLAIPITATKAGASTSATAVLILSLPVPIKFDNSYYDASYLEGTDGENVKLAQDITVTGINDGDNITVTVGDDYKTNFKIEPDSSSKWQISIINSLNSSILNDNSKLAIPITATKAGASTSATAVLILSLPVPIKFDNSYYDASYLEGTDGETVKLAQDITVTGINEGDNITVTVGDDYKTNFKIEPDSSSKWQVSIISRLNSTVLNDNSKLAIPITATKAGASTSATAVLILSLPVPIKFDNSYYDASYLEGTDGENVKLAQDITVTGINDGDNITVTVGDDYKTNFKIEPDSSSKWQVSIISRLNSTVLNDNSKLAIPITATKAGASTSATAVLILSLPVPIKFDNSYYDASYLEGTDGETVKLAQDITVTGINEGDNITVTVGDDYKTNFKIEPDSSSKWQVSIISRLNSTVLNDNLKLAIPITATKAGASTSATAVLILSLPVPIKFDNSYYAASYLEGTDGETVKLAQDITVTGINEGDNITVTVGDDYKTNFKIEPDSSSKWQVSIISRLNSTVLNDNSKLAIPITATKAGASTSATAVLILSLPVPIKFDNSYYAASYLEGTDGETVKLAQDITVTGINEGDNITVTVGDDYKTNFKIEPDSSSKWQVSIISRLNSTVLNDNSKLAIPITATKAGASASATAVLILSLPVPIKFDNSYYAASYLEATDGDTVKLAQDITVTGIDEEGDIKITVGDDYKNNFQITQDQSKKWQISVIISLNDTTLRENKQLAIPITASKAGASGSSTAVLILTLPDKNDIKFDSSYYSASYLRGNNVDSLVLDQSLRITGAKESDEITIKVGEGLEDNFEGTCNTATSECTITVIKYLNESVLSVYDQLLVTLIATAKDQLGTGESVLLLKLPSKNSTFSFSKPYYSANYLIQKSDTEEATISLEDVISFENATTDIDIVPQYYSEYFGFRFNSSTWNLNLVKNLEEDILENATQLIVTLIATKQDDSSNVAKSTLIIKLPDKLTIAFAKQNYYAEYVIDDPSSPEVVLDSDYEIELLDSDNCKIVLDTFADNFVIVQDSNSKWTLNIAQPLNSSILTQYSELNIMITITKINISYGTAGLTIKLPSLSFSEDVYSSEYSVDENDVGNIIVSKDIKIDNVDPEYVQLNLTDYGEYFYTERIDDKWTIKVGKSLPATLTDGSPLITSLVARRQNDKILATSTLVISMPSENSTYAPKFSTFIYYGNYKNTDTPTVELTDSISFESENFVKISEVYIDSAANYSSNFIVENGENDQYSIKVETPLIQEVVNDVISIALTLVAKSTEGNYGYATLVIELPKKERNTSVQVENQEILFTGTYKDGVFTIPTIPIVTNSADDADISVDISNDLGLDNKYFKYTYSNKKLSVEVNDLPDDVLKNTSVIPLKLAITDRNTQDTIYAVLNMQITSSSNDNSGDNNGDNSGDIGLIIAVSILAALLGLLLLGGFLFWFFKLRNNRKYAEMTDDNVETPAKISTFTKNGNKKPVPQLSSPQRRPTGLPIGFISPPSEETSSDQDASIDTSPSNEKRVVFNDRVDKIEQDNEVDDDENASDEFQSVAARRPTKFVFGYPLEEGVLDDPTERRESSDFINRESSDSPDFVDSGRKKSVAFDENVERMHIDPVEGAEDESDSEASGTAEENTNDTPSSQSVGGDELLPSQIFKEIF